MHDIAQHFHLLSKSDDNLDFFNLLFNFILFNDYLMIYFALALIKTKIIFYIKSTYILLIIQSFYHIEFLLLFFLLLFLLKSFQNYTNRYTM